MTVPPAGIVPRLLASWVRPAQVLRGLRDMPERALIVILMAALAVFFIAQWPVHARAAHLDPSIPLAARLGGAGLAVMFIMPLLAYALATVSAAVMRLIGRRIDPRHARLALFWALLAVSPVMLLAGLSAGLSGPGVATTLVQALAGIGFVVIWMAGLSALSRGRNDPE